MAGGYRKRGRCFWVNLRMLFDFRETFRMGRTNHCRCGHPKKTSHLRRRLAHPPHCCLAKQTTRPRYLPSPALQTATPTPPLSSQPDGLMAPNPKPRPFAPENFGPLDSSPDDMVQRSRGIQSGLSGHNQPSSHFPPSVKSIQKQRSPYHFSIHMNG